MLAHSFDERWSGSLAGYHVGEVMALGGVQRVAAYERWDGRLAYRFRSGGGNGELALAVRNLLDERHFEYETVNQPPGRIAWLNLKLDL
jgi:iron complex outermembrane receptor protein